MKRFLSLFLSLALLLSFSCVSFADGRVRGVELTVNGSAYGLEELDELFEDLGLTVQVGAPDGSTVILDTVLQLPGNQSFRLVLTGSKEEICFKFPDLDEKYYCINLQEFLSELQKLAAKNGVPLPINVKNLNPAELVSPIDVMRFLNKYGDIISGIVTSDNVTNEHTAYCLEAIGENVECDVMRFAPSKGDWSSMIEKLIRSLKTDKQFRAFLKTALSSVPASAGMGSPDSILIDFYSMLNDLLEETDTISEYLSTYSVTVAYDDDRPYAIRLDGEDLNLGYESCGDPSDIRFDVLALYDEEPAILAVNQLSAVETAIEDLFFIPALNFSLSFSYNMFSSEFSAELAASSFDASCAYTKEGGKVRFSALVDSLGFHGELDATYESTDDKDVFSMVVSVNDFVADLEVALKYGDHEDELSAVLNAGDFAADLTVTNDNDGTITAVFNAGDFAADMTITDEYIDGKDVTTVMLNAGDFSGSLILTDEYKDGKETVSAVLDAGDYSGTLFVTNEHKDSKDMISVVLDTEDVGGQLNVTVEEKELALALPTGEKVMLHTLDELKTVLDEVFG